MDSSVRVHMSPKLDVSQAALRSCLLGAFAAFVCASLLIGGLFFLDLHELTLTSPGGASPWELIGLSILFAGFGFVAGPACFGEDRRGDDY